MKIFYASPLQEKKNLNIWLLLNINTIIIIMSFFILKQIFAHRIIILTLILLISFNDFL